MANPDQLNYILHQDRELADAIVSDDNDKLQKLIAGRLKEQNDRKRQEMQRIQKLNNADVNDIEA